MCNLPYSENRSFQEFFFPWWADYDSVCLVLKTTTISLTDIIALLSWPKNWTIENVSTHLAF
jgi:hypothetical protein